MIYRGQPGFVHKNYLEIIDDQISGKSPHRKLAPRAGIILAGAGIILVASILAPEVLLAAAGLGAAMVTIAIGDFLFDLGLVYSVSFVLVGVFVTLLFFKKRKKDRVASTNENQQKKAS